MDNRWTRTPAPLGRGHVPHTEVNIRALTVTLTAIWAVTLWPIPNSVAAHGKSGRRAEPVVTASKASRARVTRAQMAFWTRDAECETGSAPPHWDYGKPGSGHGGSLYEGGIAFAPSTWRWWGREVGAYPRYQHAYNAPPALQAAAAQWGLDNIGKWGCVWKLT